MRRLVLVLASAALVGVVLPPRALPARGVALDIGRIEISQKLTPGGGYNLPTFHVRNPGTETTTYIVSVSYIRGQHGKPPPGSWFQFHPSTLTLKPGESRAVRSRISLPTGADPASYAGLISVAVGSAGTGAQVGAAAAVRISFTVEPATFLGAVWERVKTILSDTAPWSWLIPALLAAAALLFFVGRRFSIRLERRA